MFDFIKSFFTGKSGVMTQEDFKELINEEAQREEKIEKKIGGVKVNKSKNKGVYIAFYDTPNSVIQFEEGKNARVINDRIVMQFSHDGKNVRENRYNKIEQFFTDIIDLQTKETKFHDIRMEKTLKEHYEKYAAEFIKNSTDKDSLTEIVEEALKQNTEKMKIMQDVKIIEV